MGFLDDFFNKLSEEEQDDAVHEEELYNKIDSAVDLMNHYKEQAEGFRDRCFQMADIIKDLRQQLSNNKQQSLSELRNQIVCVCGIFSVNKNATEALLKCFDSYVTGNKRND